jgi:O-acetyl-ADP-ribose deacetylase (regulator of RNase III)
MREVTIGASRLQLMRGDITRLGRHVGAIVNAANEGLWPGGGVCGAIHRAGGPEIAAECRRIGGIDTGQAVPTTAGRLDADAVIHAVGPVWQGRTQDEDRLLASAYRSSLEIAARRGLTSIAFPSISTGIYGYPVDRAAAVAIATVGELLEQGSAVEEVIFVLFSDADYAAYAAALERWAGPRAAAADEPPAVR